MIYVASLSLGELRDAVLDENPKRLAISGFVHLTERVLYLTMADGSLVTTSLDYFEPNPTATPDFAKFSITDWGQSLAFGNYEASVDTLLRSQREV